LKGGGRRRVGQPSRGISDAIELFCESRDERKPVDPLTMSEVDTKQDWDRRNKKPRRDQED